MAGTLFYYTVKIWLSDREKSIILKSYSLNSSTVVYGDFLRYSDIFQVKANRLSAICHLLLKEYGGIIRFTEFSFTSNSCSGTPSLSFPSRDQAPPLPQRTPEWRSTASKNSTLMHLLQRYTRSRMSNIFNKTLLIWSAK